MSVYNYMYMYMYWFFLSIPGTIFEGKFLRYFKGFVSYKRVSYKILFISNWINKYNNDKDANILIMIMAQVPWKLLAVSGNATLPKTRHLGCECRGWGLHVHLKSPVEHFWQSCRVLVHYTLVQDMALVSITVNTWFNA